MPLSLSPGFRGRGSLAGRPLHLQLLHSRQAQGPTGSGFSCRQWRGGGLPLGPAGGHRTQLPVLWTLQPPGKGLARTSRRRVPCLPSLWRGSGALSVRNGEGRQAVMRSRTHGFGQGGLSYARAPSPPPGWGQPLTFLREGFAASWGWNSALASSHVTLSKWPHHLESWSPGKPGEVGRGEPAHKPPPPRPWPSLQPHTEPQPLRSPGSWVTGSRTPARLPWSPCPRVPRPASCPSFLLPQPCSMQPQESGVQYSRWDDRSQDEVHVAAGSSAEAPWSWER